SNHEKPTRRRYTKEFREEAVQMINKSKTHDFDPSQENRFRNASCKGYTVPLSCAAVDHAQQEAEFQFND
ncbi:MAG: hypothetical protein O2945_16325, partial [Planctomycetota bacterium]|nr:hypothetical protein [Planctomycetota bacterium]